MAGILRSSATSVPTLRNGRRPNGHPAPSVGSHPREASVDDGMRAIAAHELSVAHALDLAGQLPLRRRRRRRHPVIQLLQIADRVSAAGRRAIGHKVGLTSAAMRRQMGVRQPDYGHLLDRMFWLEHEPIAISSFLQPRVEPEIAFVLREAAGGPA